MKMKIIYLIVIVCMIAKAQEDDLKTCPVKIMQEVQKTEDTARQKQLFLLQALHAQKKINKPQKYAYMQILLKKI